MAYQLKIIGSMELCLLVYSGRVQATEFDAVWRVTEGTPEYSPEFDDIGLLAPDADYSDISHEVALRQSIRFVEAFRGKSLKRKKHCAFVCSNEMQITMAKMFGAYVYGQGVPNVAVEAFTSLEPALNWIADDAKSARRLDRSEIARLATQMGAGWCLKSAFAA